MYDSQGDHLIRTEFAYPKDLKSASNIGQLERITQPDGRVLGIQYDLNGWVIALNAPIGHGTELVPFAHFIYGDHTREWLGAEGQRTKYQLDGNSVNLKKGKCIGSIGKEPGQLTL